MRARGLHKRDGVDHSGSCILVGFLWVLVLRAVVVLGRRSQIFHGYLDLRKFGRWWWFWGTGLGTGDVIGNLAGVIFVRFCGAVS